MPIWKRWRNALSVGDEIRVVGDDHRGLHPRVNGVEQSPSRPAVLCPPRRFVSWASGRRASKTLIRVTTLRVSGTKPTQNDG